MKVLFDQNVPKNLTKHLIGHDVTRAKELHWEELKNGDLIKAAEEHGFDVLVSCDRSLVYQQRVEGRRVAILALSTNNWPLMSERTAAIRKAVDAVRPGMYLFVDCGDFLPARTKRKARQSGGNPEDV